MKREKVVALMAENPGELLNRFGIGREEFLDACVSRTVSEIREECGGAFTGLMTLPMSVAHSLTGLALGTLLTKDHIDNGNRNKRMTLAQVCQVIERATVRKSETPEEKVERLERELSEARREAA